MIHLGFDHSYRRLPERFHAAQPPARAPAPRLLAFNRPLAEDLGFDPAIVEPLAGPEMVRLMRGGVPLTPMAEQLGYLFEKESLALKGL